MDLIFLYIVLEVFKFLPTNISTGVGFSRQMNCWSVIQSCFQQDYIFLPHNYRENYPEIQTIVKLIFLFMKNQNLWSSYQYIFQKSRQCYMFVWNSNTSYYIRVTDDCTWGILKKFNHRIWSTSFIKKFTSKYANRPQ